MVLDPNDPDEVQRVHAFTERLARYVKSHSWCQYCFLNLVFSDLVGLAEAAVIHQVVYSHHSF